MARKKKRKKESITRLNEFRRDLADHRKHYGFVFARLGNDLVFLRLTHKKKDGYLRLSKNPDPNDKQPAYLKPTPKRQNISRFKDPRPGWELSEFDLKRVQEYLTIPSKRK